MQILGIIPSAIQCGTSPGVTSGNSGHYAISVRCFIESSLRQRFVRGSYNRIGEGNISHCVFPFPKVKQQSNRGAIRGKNFSRDDKSIFVPSGDATGSIHPQCSPCFPIRHFDFSSRKLFRTSLENQRNLREWEKNDFLSFSFLLSSVFLFPRSNFSLFVPKDGSFLAVILPLIIAGEIEYRF